MSADLEALEIVRRVRLTLPSYHLMSAEERRIDGILIRVSLYLKSKWRN